MQPDNRNITRDKEGVSASLRRYLFPLGFGIATYTVIRLLTDPNADRYIWDRPWQTTVIELAGAIAIAYVLFYGIALILRRFDKTELPADPRRQIFREVGVVFLFTIVLVNLTVIPFTAVTDDGLQVHDFITNNLAILFLVMIWFTYVRAAHYIHAFSEEKANNERLQREKAESELKYLKAQINPHFLFNALNNVYHMIDEDTGLSKEMLERLSDMLRYQLYECSGDRVPLDREIGYLCDYIALQRRRKSERLKLEVDLSTQWNGRKIAPFLLQPLVENAFKYVGGKEQLCIQAKPDGENFVFKVENTVADHHPNEDDPGGIGLENLRRRLELLYPDRHELEISADDGWFRAKLRLGKGNKESRKQGINETGYQ